MSAKDEVVGYHPDMKPQINGQQCFLNMDRPCGADCMAFQTDRPQGVEYNGQWANCLVLTTAHKAAKHLIVLAQCGGTLVKQAQDQERKNQTAPSINIPRPVVR